VWLQGAEGREVVERGGDGCSVDRVSDGAGQCVLERQRAGGVPSETRIRAAWPGDRLSRRGSLTSARPRRYQWSDRGDGVWRGGAVVVVGSLLLAAAANAVPSHSDIL